MSIFPDVKPNDETITLQSSNQAYSSVLTGDTQSAELAGDRWSIRMQFSNRKGEEAAKLRAFIFSLGGRRTRFTYSPESIDNLGELLGSGIVAGAGQLGLSIDTSGWNVSQTLFKAGDYFEVNGELKTVTADVVVGGDGLATIPFAPKLRNSPPDGANIITTKPSATFRLEDDDQASFQVTGPVIYNASFALVEDF